MSIGCSKKDALLEECLELVEQEGESLDSVVGRFPEAAEELKADLQAALWLRDQGKCLEARPGWLAASQQRMIALIQSKDPESRLWRWGKTLVWGRLAVQFILAILLFAMGFLTANGLVHASQTWLPGDWTYPLKLGQEQLELSFATTPARRASLHIQFAQRRIMEAQALVFEGRDAQIPATVDNFEKQVGLAVWELQLTSDQNSEQALRLAASMGQMLSSQTSMLGLLAGFTPQPTQAEFRQMLSISKYGLAALEELSFSDQEDQGQMPSVEAF